MGVRELNLTKDQLDEILNYDRVTGVFTWKRDMGQRGLRDSVAGSYLNNGYVRIKIHGRLYQAHRLAWVVLYEEQPPNEIDHINGVKTDNRPENLRAASRGGNCQNTRIRKDNSSGLKGVSWNSRAKKWRARCNFENRQYNLGNFHSKEDAHAAYLKFAKERFGEFYREEK